MNLALSFALSYPTTAESSLQPTANLSPTMSEKSHRRRANSTSSIEDFTLLEFEHPISKTDESDAVLQEVDLSIDYEVPQSSLVVLTETDKLEEFKEEIMEKPVNDKAGVDLTFNDFEFTKLRVRDWDGKKGYSTYIKEGLAFLDDKRENYIMLYETPSTFRNTSKFKFHDWPPTADSRSKGVLGPCRYASMNGPDIPVFLRDETPPAGLMKHWQEAVPGFVPPSFVSKVDLENDCVYAYVPVESIHNHVNDPATHYHLAGKDAIHLMTQKTTKLLPDTRTSRPCVVKTTHSMGSKGIFIIQNDQDEAEFEKFLHESGHPNFVVTDFVDIARNVACHFFMHPNGKDVVWFGSNENKRGPDGRFSMDSYFDMNDQDSLKKMQLPFVEEVVQYCKSLGFWGFCGCDVLFDSNGSGYLVDINPRVTGSCPALMTLSLLKQEYGFDVGLFRRNGDINYFGSSQELLEEVGAYNKGHEGNSRIILHSLFETPSGNCRINIGVYGNDMDECKTVLNCFALPSKKNGEKTNGQSV